MTTGRVIARAPDGSQALQGPLSDEELRLITAELYRASAEAIAAFDPEDTLAARLESEWIEVDSSDEEPTEEELGSFSNDGTKPAAAPRRQLRVEGGSARFTSSSKAPDRWDPNPPPH